MVRAYLFTVVVLFILLAGTDAHAAYAPCNTYTPSQGVPQGYGSAFNVVQGTNEALVSVECDGRKARVTVGTTDEWQYTYHQGYVYRNGTWKRFTLTGTELLADAWITGPARTTLSLTQAEAENEMYVVGYVCTWTGSQWKCGCRNASCSTSLWQLMRFTSISEDLPDADEIGSGYSGVPLLQGPTSYTGPRGTRIQLLGAGFGGSNRIIFTSRDGTQRTIATVGSTNGGSRTAEFTIPNNLPYGMHKVTLRRGNTLSENDTFFVVTRPGTEPPRVTSVSPQTVTQGSRITVRGTGFTPQGNDVMTTYGLFSNLPSPDGTSLSFTLRVFPDEPLIESPRPQSERQNFGPVYIYLRNDNGISGSPVTTTLSL